MSLETLFIDPKAANKQYSDDEKKRMVIAYQKSGMTMKDWCFQKGINHQTFKNWPHRLGLSKS